MRHMQRTGVSIQAQRGFSMVEMLMTAFILAVGIMGLTLLQVMSLKAGRGGKSLSTAVQVGEMVMDQIEMEGRLSWLNLTATEVRVPPPLTSLQYVGRMPLAAPLPFTTKGRTPLTLPLSPGQDPIDAAVFYQVTVVEANVRNLATGRMGDFVVDVLFSDQVNPATGVAIPRHVVLTRSILHG